MLAKTTVEDEIELISRAQDGDREAFGELVCRYRLGAVNVVYRMCGNSDLAEDAAQTAFIRAWQHLLDFRPRSSFRNWLYRIAVNAALDILRSEKPEEDISGLHAAAAQEDVESHLEKKERLKHVRQAVLSLPEASRAVLILREYEGLTYQEISETLDVPIGTVMSRLNYARKRLIGLLHPFMEEA